MTPSPVRADHNCPKQIAHDGPCRPYTWRHEGTVAANHMQPAAWRLVDHLWRRPQKAATFDELKQPVYSDPEHIADQSNFGSLRTRANTFLSQHGIPWQVRIKKGLVFLMLRDSGVT
jgi:hypothetical protein